MRQLLVLLVLLLILIKWLGRSAWVDHSRDARPAPAHYILKGTEHVDRATGTRR